jgi:Fe-S-cluster containining protein
MSDEPFVFSIDWELGKDDFQASIRDMMKECITGRKVLSLPIELIPGMSFLTQIALLTCQVNCADCCKCCEVGEGRLIDIIPLEYQYLANKYGTHNFIMDGMDHAIPYPCPFLKSHRCSIYGDRPFVCAMFPFQPGGTAGENMEIKTVAISSQCPEARRITRAVYMNLWRLRRQLARAVGELPKGV